MACSLQGGSGSRNASPALVLRPPWPPRRCESGASSRLQCRAARKPRAASCLAAAQRMAMATTDNRGQQATSTSKGAASSKRKSTPQCHTQRAASALSIKAARPKEDLELITPRGRYIGPIRQPPEETTYIRYQICSSALSSDSPCALRSKPTDHVQRKEESQSRRGAALQPY